MKEHIIGILENMRANLQGKHDAFLGTEGEIPRKNFKLGLSWAISSIEDSIMEIEGYLDDVHPPHEPCMVIYKPKEFIRELEQALNKKG